MGNTNEENSLMNITDFDIDIEEIDDRLEEL
jgi:hypothetical protein